MIDEKILIECIKNNCMCPETCKYCKITSHPSGQYDFNACEVLNSWDSYHSSTLKFPIFLNYVRFRLKELKLQKVLNYGK